MLEASHRYFHQAADVLDLAPKVRDILLSPNRVVKVEIVAPLARPARVVVLNPEAGVVHKLAVV